MGSWLNNMSFINLYKPDDNGKQKCLVQSVFGGTFDCNYEMVPARPFYRVECSLFYYMLLPIYYAGSQCFKGDSNIICNTHLQYTTQRPARPSAPGVVSASSESSEKHSSSKSTSSRSSWHSPVNMDALSRWGDWGGNHTLEPRISVSGWHHQDYGTCTS